MGAEKKKFPKIRFEGFSKDWGQEKLRTIFSFSKGKGYSKSSLVDDGNPILLYGSLYTDYKSNIKNVKTYAYPLDKSIYSTGDEVILPSSGESDIDIARASAVSQKGVLLGGDLNILKPKKSLNSVFMALNLTYSSINLSLIKRAQGQVVVHLYNSDIQNLKITIPEFLEQTQIGNFFQKMDEVIELQQKRLALTQDYKKSMLQKMFPQKGEKVPRVRFGGFSGEWGTTYFKNIAKVRRGLTYSPSDVVTNQKGVRVLRSSNIDEDTLIVSDTDVFVRESAVKIDYIKMNEILITAANGSSRLVGKHAIINRDLQNTVHGGFMLAVSTSHPEFLNSWMNGAQYKKMLQLVQGGNGAIGNLSRSMLEECKITLPCLKEQTAIGNFFQKLDEKIEVESAKLEKLQVMKKAMLQRMFV